MGDKHFSLEISENHNKSFYIQIIEAAVHRCSSKYVFFKISQISQENTCVGVSLNQVSK